MARPWRIEYEGALYYVFSRSNNQQDICVTDDDRYLFLDTIIQGLTNPTRPNVIFCFICYAKKASIQIYRLGAYWV